MSGLALLSRELDSKLQQASPVKRRAASLVACKHAVAKAGIADPLVNLALEELQVGRGFQPDLKAKLDALTEKLDEEYFNLKEAAEEGRGDEKEYRRAFAKARTVAAVSCAGDLDDQKAGEAIYEAAFAFEDDERSQLLSVVDAELGK